MSQTITLELQGRPLVLRRPTAAEFDVALAQRLTRQFFAHRARKNAVEPGPGCALEWDRAQQLELKAMEQLLALGREGVQRCGLTWGGEPIDALPEVDDTTMQAWADVTARLVNTLTLEVPPGKSSPLSA